MQIRLSNRRKFRTSLGFLLLILAISRILLALVVWDITGPSGFHAADSPSYLRPATSLLHGAFLDGNGQPAVLRTPGYPLLLVPAVLSGHVEAVAFVENLLFSLATGWLIWQICQELFRGPAVAWWAVAFYVAEPLGWLSSITILSDTAFCTLLLLTVWLFIRFLKIPGRRTLVFAALALAAATWERPISIYLSFLLAVWLLLHPRRLPLGTRAAGALLFQVLFLAFLAPWMIRNAAVADYYGFSSAGAENLYFNSAGSINARLEHRTLDGYFAAHGKDETPRYFNTHPEQRQWTRGRIFRFWTSEGIRIIASHPWLYLGIHLRGCAVVLFDPAATDLLKVFGEYPEHGGLLSRTLDQGFFRATVWLVRNYPVTAIILPLLAAQMLIYYVFAIFGMLKLPAETRWLVALIAGYLVLVSGMPGANARYRLPVMPLVCISAGIAVAAFRRKHEVRPAAIVEPAI